MKYPKFDDGDWVLFAVLSTNFLITRNNIDMKKPFKIRFGNKKIDKQYENLITLEKCPLKKGDGKWHCSWFKKINSKFGSRSLDILYGEIN